MKNKEIEQHHLEMQKKLNEFARKKGYPIEDFKFVAVGYLSIDEEFEKGEVSINFLNKLKILWHEGGTTGSLGHHECEFCIKEGNYENRGMSNSEKMLIDRENKIKYLFPEMIFHYCTEHKFKPCDAFIKFVMRI